MFFFVFFYTLSVVHMHTRGFNCSPPDDVSCLQYGGFFFLSVIHLKEIPEVFWGTLKHEFAHHVVCFYGGYCCARTIQRVNKMSEIRILISTQKDKCVHVNIRFLSDNLRIIR